MVLRAKDQASRVIADVGRSFGHLEGDAKKAAMSSIHAGTALIGLGTGIAAIGAVGLVAMNNARRAAVDYNKEAALTLTQVDQTGVKLEDIKRIGKDVARAIPAPFEQMQSSLYDIFSSMDVNVKQAETLLRSFAKAAVTGNTDVQTSGRATIAIMNAFKIPAEDVNRVMDIQFQTVRKGVITYEEYASTIGRSIPSAVKAGQSIESLSGMIAFMTRNGLSAAMASTSAARALDLLANPKFGKEMKELGINVADASGKFRPMAEVSAELRDKLSGMSEQARANKLKELTEGAGGTIQAMRFLNLAVGDSKGLLQELTGQVQNSGGAMQKGYDIMFNQPANQAQLLKNNFAILKTEVGDTLIPAFNKLVKVGLTIVRWFNDLSPHTKDLIIKGTIIASVLMTVVGVLTILAGSFLVLSGAAAMLGTTLGAIALTMGAVTLAIAAVAVAGYLIYKNWDKIKAFAVKTWNAIKDTVAGAWDSIKEIVGSGVNFVQDLFNTVWGGIKDGASATWEVLQTIFNGIATAVNIVLVTPLRFLAEVFMEVFNAIGAVISFWWNNVSKPVFDFVVVVLSTIIDVVRTFFDIWFTVLTAIGVIVTTFGDIVLKIFEIIVKVAWHAVLKPMLEAMRDFFIGTLRGIADVVVWFYDSVIKPIWDGIVAVIRWAWENVILPIWNALTEYIRGQLTGAFNTIRDVWNSVWEFVRGVLSGAWGVIRGIFDAIGGFIRGPLTDYFNTIKTAWNTTWEGMGDIVKTVWDTAKGVVIGGVNSVINTIEGMINGAIGGINRLIDAANAVPGVDIKKLGKVNLPNVGKKHSGGMIEGAGEVLAILKGGEGVLNERAMAQLGESGLNRLNAGGGPSSVSHSSAVTIEEGAFQVNIYDASDPVAVRAQVDQALDELLRTLKQRST